MTSSSIDTGLNIKELGGLYINFNADKLQLNKRTLTQMKEKRKASQAIAQNTFLGLSGTHPPERPVGGTMAFPAEAERTAGRGMSSLLPTRVKKPLWKTAAPSGSCPVTRPLVTA